jgi:hypothetical protein
VLRERVNWIDTRCRLRTRAHHEFARLPSPSLMMGIRAASVPGFVRLTRSAMDQRPVRQFTVTAGRL